jgi:hypothetical protein
MERYVHVPIHPFFKLKSILLPLLNFEYISCPRIYSHQQTSAYVHTSSLSYLSSVLFFSLQNVGGMSEVEFTTEVEVSGSTMMLVIARCNAYYAAVQAYHSDHHTSQKESQLWTLDDPLHWNVFGRSNKKANPAAAAQNNINMNVTTGPTSTSTSAAKGRHVPAEFRPRLADAQSSSANASSSISRKANTNNTSIASNTNSHGNTNINSNSNAEKEKDWVDEMASTSWSATTAAEKATAIKTIHIVPLARTPTTTTTGEHQTNTKTPSFETPNHTKRYEQSQSTTESTITHSLSSSRTRKRKRPKTEREKDSGIANDNDIGNEETDVMHDASNHSYPFHPTLASQSQDHHADHSLQQDVGARHSDDNNKDKEDDDNSPCEPQPFDEDCDGVGDDALPMPIPLDSDNNDTDNDEDVDEERSNQKYQVTTTTMTRDETEHNPQVLSSSSKNMITNNVGMDLDLAANVGYRATRMDLHNTTPTTMGVSVGTTNTHTIMHGDVDVDLDSIDLDFLTGDEPWMGCVCGETHPAPIEVFWIQCDDPTCRAWYNVSAHCVGFDQDGAEDVHIWTCRTCSYSCGTAGASGVGGDGGGDGPATTTTIATTTNNTTQKNNKPAGLAHEQRRSKQSYDAVLPDYASSKKKKTSKNSKNVTEDGDEDGDDDDDDGTTQASSGDVDIPAAEPVKTDFEVGDLVNVESRSWPGINSLGGVAKVTRVHHDYVDAAYDNAADSDDDDNGEACITENEGQQQQHHHQKPKEKKAEQNIKKKLYDVNYVVHRGRESNIPAKYVHYQAGPSDAPAPSRKRKPRKLLCLS